MGASNLPLADQMRRVAHFSIARQRLGTLWRKQAARTVTKEFDN